MQSLSPLVSLQDDIDLSLRASKRDLVVREYKGLISEYSARVVALLPSAFKSWTDEDSLGASDEGTLTC